MLRDTIIQAKAELQAAITQSLPADDQIIMEHVRTAAAMLDIVLKQMPEKAGFAEQMAAIWDKAA